MRSRDTYLASAVSVVVGCLLPLMASEDTPPPQTIETRLVNSNALDLGYGTCQWLWPLEAPKEKLAAEPTYRSRAPVYYAARYGDAEDNIFTFVIDESGGAGKGYDTLYVDADNDNRIDPDKERFTFKLRQAPIRLKIQVRAGGRTAPYWVSFTAFLYSDEKHPKEKIHANLRDASYYAGEAVFDGKSRKIAIADLNSNGLFNDVEMGIFTGDRFFIDLNDDGSLKDDKGEDLQAGFPYAKYTQIRGRWYSIVARADGGSVTISTATPPLGLVKAPPMVASAVLRSKSQSCFPRFASGAAQGVAGTYQVQGIRLTAKDGSGRDWQTTGSFPKDAYPQVTIRENQTTRLNVGGPPFRIEPGISAKADGASLEITLQILGSAGEVYNWPAGNPSAVKPGIQVRDQSGRVQVSATLEYG